MDIRERRAAAEVLLARDADPVILARQLLTARHDRSKARESAELWRWEYLRVSTRLSEALAILRECDSPDGFCGEMPWELRERIEEFVRRTRRER
jgi:hypothetical protein